MGRTRVIQADEQRGVAGAAAHEASRPADAVSAGFGAGSAGAGYLRRLGLARWLRVGGPAPVVWSIGGRGPTGGVNKSSSDRVVNYSCPRAGSLTRWTHRPGPARDQQSR
jgi:hypothetical protein